MALQNVQRPLAHCTLLPVGLVEQSMCESTCGEREFKPAAKHPFFSRVQERWSRSEKCATKLPWATMSHLLLMSSWVHRLQITLLFLQLQINNCNYLFLSTEIPCSPGNSSPSCLFIECWDFRHPPGVPLWNLIHMPFVIPYSVGTMSIMLCSEPLPTNYPCPCLNL